MCEMLLYAGCLKEEFCHVFKTNQNRPEMTRIHRWSPKNIRHVSKGRLLGTRLAKGCFIDATTDPHDTPTTRIDSQVFLISRKNNGRKTKDKRKESGESGPMWLDWRTTWRFEESNPSPSFPKNNQRLGAVLLCYIAVNKTPCIAWRKVAPRSNGGEIMSTCTNTSLFV